MENDKVKWVGKFVRKWTLISFQLGTGEYLLNNAPNALFLLSVAFF